MFTYVKLKLKKGGSMKNITTGSRASKFFKGAILSAGIFLVSSAAFSAPVLVGAKIPKGAKATPVTDIQKSPKKFAGKKVTVQGKLFQQCPMADKGHGCWLNVLPSKGSGKPLYIEFEANGLYYPKKLKNNSMVKVSGTIKMKADESTAKSGTVKKGDVYILADGAEIIEK